MGKAKSLKDRVSSYFTSKDLYGKTKLLVEQIYRIKIVVVQSELESLILEANLIKKYIPKYNIRLRDGKEYPLIRITGGEFPAVLTARREEDPASTYFGPFPNATAMREVLRYLRRIFPYQSVLNHQKKICLYHHLGLCPCASAIATLDAKKEYKKTIRHIKEFLRGKTKKVLDFLEKDRNSESKKEHFENANILQQQIDKINIITHPFHKPFEYETNPNLTQDLREIEMEELRIILGQHNVYVSSLKRIECYDISNTQGTNATGSMVVFTNGEKDGANYRKFKIIQKKGPNDFAMMAEVFARRLKHTEWQYPDLFIVDGGKGQISSAKKVLDANSITIPLVGLAKRNEIIITSDFREIRLPKKNHALQLVMRIRNEAHRFAITYHKKIRSRITFS
ncbi:MAG: hypothetical protein ACREGI_00925 [Candidatus Levyibacteriota bacterium]